jgi:CHAT domain-containing protein
MARDSLEKGAVERGRELLHGAVEVVERLGRGRSEAGGERGRADLFEDAIVYALKAEDISLAFEYMERAKARNLLDVLSTRTVELPSERSKELLGNELRTREAVLRLRRAKNLGQEISDRDLENARATHRRAKATLQREYPHIARTFTITPKSLDALRKNLPRGHTVVQYFLGRAHLHALIITRDGAMATRTKSPRTKLTTEIEVLSERMRAFAEVDQQLATLSDSLIAPIAEHLREAKGITFVPDGALYHVPFGALRYEGKTMLEYIPVSQAPSATVLVDMLRQSPVPVRGSVTALAHGQDLPFAHLEARRVGDTVLTGAEATESALQNTSGVVNVAAHTELQIDDPLMSAILVAADEEEDGRLEVREIYGLQSMPALISLSACNSDRPSTGGDEWLSLANAFLTAGSRIVIATKSRVSDLAASVLMKRFYRLLKRHRPAVALQKASLWTRGYFEHPSHWANFMLIGDFR